ncbi:hypothetical protein BKA66DRAFT_421931 [Pyrenochaeta sp. MPI-SDFR-AT-0127]|nr:hypothetical protein BKA66DRAFT_421931 [Pyrenochaeta sp. MPI-SDFR-AT-0127]
MTQLLHTTIKEDKAGIDNNPQETQSKDAPPSYTPDTSQPPSYESVSAALSSLATGDPDETISVPMIHRRDSTSIHRLNPFSRKDGGTKQYITARKMKREQYLKHYAKDADGNYVGTHSPAPDAGLVFVLGKSTPEDLLRQVEEVAFGMQERRGDGIGKFGKPLK